jgi:hypothetical protein
MTTAPDTLTQSRARPLPGKFNLQTVLLVLVFAPILSMAIRPATDPDLWWHLRTGQLIVQTGAIPHTDPFSFTFQGQPWITHEWLTEVLIYGLYQLGGYDLLIATFALVVATAFVLTYLRCPQGSRPYLAALAVLLGVFMSAPTFGVRPQVVSLLFTSIVLFLLDRYRQEAKLRYVLSLPFLMALWVNLHGGYILGIGIIAVVVSGELLEWLFIRRTKREEPNVPSLKPILVLLAVLATCILATLANPNGLEIWTYPFRTLGDSAVRAYIDEWQSPNFHNLNMLSLLLMILALIGLGMAGRQRVRLPDALLTLIFAFFALQSVRHIPLFALVAAPVLAEEITSLVQVPSTVHFPPRWAWLGPVLALAVLVLPAGRLMRSVAEQPQAESSGFPQKATDWILAHQPAGPLFNDYNWGGYLIWRLNPAYPVFIDGRAQDVYTPDFITQYANTVSGTPGWRDTFERYDIRVALISPGSALADALRHTPGWTAGYEDEQTVVFVFSG